MIEISTTHFVRADIIEDGEIMPEIDGTFRVVWRTSSVEMYSDAFPTREEARKYLIDKIKAIEAEVRGFV